MTAPEGSTVAPHRPPPAEREAPPTVELQGVHRRFGGVEALTDLDLEVPAGRITVLLGPNGAGKTTAIRTITGALDPHAGTVRVFGLDPAVDGEEVRRRCGVVSAKPALYDRLSGFDNLLYSAELYGLGRGAATDARIHEAAGRFGIDHALDQQVGGFSTGMKTRLALARSLLHRPDLLLFDEPTSGLDPESSHAVLEMIRDLTAEGATVIMCTHLLLEAEGLADKVVVLEGGTDLVAGVPDDLTRQFWPYPLLRLDAEDPGALPVALELPGVRRVHEGNPVVAEIDDLGLVPDLVAALVRQGVRLTRVEPHEPSLEDLYFAVRSRGTMADDGGRRLQAARLAAMRPSALIEEVPS